MLVGLDDLETRARAATLDFGGTLTPGSLRMLACDAAVVPVVMNGAGQPLDIGRATRIIPDGLRRAVVLMRVLQGLGAGAEFGGASTLLAEHAPHERRGYYTS